jgi:hypothetical protein
MTGVPHHLHSQLTHESVKYIQHRSLGFQWLCVESHLLRLRYQLHKLGMFPSTLHASKHLSTIHMTLVPETYPLPLSWDRCNTLSQLGDVSGYTSQSICLWCHKVCRYKCVHFCRQVVIFILSRHVHPCAHDVFCLDLRDCDVCVVVVEGSSDTNELFF